MRRRVQQRARRLLEAVVRLVRRAQVLHRVGDQRARSLRWDDLGRGRGRMLRILLARVATYGAVLLLGAHPLHCACGSAGAAALVVLTVVADSASTV